jgi:ppGpp synthetase/RelA/SpoT-type nucleotidyltranferase
MIEGQEMDATKLDRASVAAEYARRENIYKRLLEESHFIIERGLGAEKLKYHSIPSRIKTIDSLMGKIERSHNEETRRSFDPFAEINDIVGLRVVCLFLSDITRVGQVIRTHFKVLSEDNKIEGSDLSSFGYMSVHFVVAIKDSFSGSRYDDLRGIPFEIQIRTIAMDAWASISHYLSYKSSVDVPKELRRDFYALSGLFYVADSHFEMFFKGREQKLKQISSELEVGHVDKEINLDTLSEFLLSRLPDRKRAEPSGVSELVSELIAVGYKNLKNLNEAFERTWDAFLKYEKDNPPSNGPEFMDIGVVRILLSIYDKDYRNSRGVDENPYSQYENMIVK